jgi:hypothetical protein
MEAQFREPIGRHIAPSMEMRAGGARDEYEREAECDACFPAGGHAGGCEPLRVEKGVPAHCTGLFDSAPR